MLFLTLSVGGQMAASGQCHSCLYAHIRYTKKVCACCKYAFNTRVCLLTRLPTSVLFDRCIMTSRSTPVSEDHVFGS